MLEMDELIFDAEVTGEANRNKWNLDHDAPQELGPAMLGGRKNHIHISVKY